MQVGPEPASGIRRPLDPEVQVASRDRFSRRDAGPGSGLRWWVEVLLVLGFYVVYSTIRNLFGSESISAADALANAERIIDLERSIGLYLELDLQQAFVDHRWFIQFWNLFYGTFHFAVTVFALVWVYRRFPHLYARHRSTFLCTTGLALVGFSLFPLMPPRLLSDCGEFGGCLATLYPYVDTVTDVGGLWSFDSGTMQSVSNQYAAMPSLHFAWAAWSALVLWPIVRNRTARVLVAAYPVATLFAVIVTGNHFWLDAVGGLVVLGAGSLLAGVLVRAWAALHRPASR
ncbi:MAG: hypothetical protein CL446_04445 [Acidimicrobiaceae bacterium]|nr:hypothetical protein [Acidimicrobiaceae bacterium]